MLALMLLLPLTGIDLKEGDPAPSFIAKGDDGKTHSDDVLKVP